MARLKAPFLYGREPLVGSLVPSLTGLAFHERARVKREFGSDVPVVLLTGEHGTGRSTLLDVLARGYRDRLPLAHVRAVVPGAPDAAGIAEEVPEGSVPPQPAASHAEILERLVCALTPTYGIFRELMPALFAVSGWHLGETDERDAVCRRHARMLVASGLARGTEREVARDWATEVETSISEAAARDSDPDDPDGTQPVTAAVLRQLGVRTSLGASRAWFRDRHTTPDGTIAEEDPLWLLSRRFHRGGDYLHAAEQALTAVFLGETARSHGLLRRLNREPWPLILLDDAHLPAGARFLELLLEQRALGGRKYRDRTVVVATRLGDLPHEDAPHAVRRELVDLLPPGGVRRPGHAATLWKRTGHEPSEGLLVLPLTPLTRDDILSMLDRASSRLLHPHLASALHALTGGHPSASTVLADAAVETAKQNRAVVPRDLLDLRVKGGRPVTEVLLRDLLPDRRQRDRLVRLCLAKDSEAAEKLAQNLGLVGPEQLPATAAAQYLVERQWQQLPEAEHPLVTSELLRTLLVHEARRTLPPGDEPHSWRSIHAFLHLHHVQRAKTEEADALRHSLAAGKPRDVVVMLADEFVAEEAELSVEHWLVCLKRCASAPVPPVDESWCDQRVEIADGEHAARYADLDPSGRSINRLLHALWYLSEPYADAALDADAARMCKAVGEELGFLARRHPTWYAALGQAARDWPTAARKGQELPVPPGNNSGETG
ncbi:ATP-binding protein [Streptomyces sp. BH106]|uniref:ATP-binding protein n=1 Tax=Streptomyces sp. BH106 TaxID=3410409 RepID=UPI003CE7DD76